jgi:uncharacterized protein
MKSLLRRSLTMAAGVLFTWGIVCALDVPPLRGRINDLAGLLSQNQTSLLENQLSSFEEQSGHQIVLLTLKSLQDEELTSFALKTAEQWKLGQKGHDNWALLLVSVSDRKLRIEVGYGLEGTLPDATANQIIYQIIVPRFREKDFAGGLESGLAAIMQATRGESIAMVPQNATSPRTSNLSSILLLLVGSALIATVVGFASPSPMWGSVTGGIVAGIVGLPGFFAVGLAVWLLAVFVGVLTSSLVTLYTRRAWGRSWSVKPSRNDDFSPRDTFRYGYGGGSGGYGGGGSSGGSGGSSSGGFSGGGGGGGGGGASGGW